ncbi:MAG: helix-turn-helix transcriptional regulator [Candidatus Gastranaerophilales bacterium]|nr:helix-turn-helix transcriptional regulator [Candidatus Gastranaerophilales bacterium]
MNYQALINKNIKKLRLDNNLTQEEFAEKIGISIQGLSNIERNRYQPSAQTIDLICKKFEILPIQLLVEDKEENREIINNISTILSQCSAKRLKKIYEIIIKLVKF